ncbi:MAG: hypothetical protein AB7O62_12775 [Pirellulales bacterium]
MNTPPSRRWQFGLSSLLCMVTLLSVALAKVSLMRPDRIHSQDEAVSLLVLFGCCLDPILGVLGGGLMGQLVGRGRPQAVVDGILLGVLVTQAMSCLLMLPTACG